MIFTARTVGADRILRNLEKLERNAQLRTLREVGEEALKPVAAAMRQRAPVGKRAADGKAKPGPRYRESIGVSRRVTSKQARFVRRENRFLANTHAGAYGRPARLSHILEHGTGDRRTKTGANRGRMPAKPHMHPAWDAEGPGLTARVARLLWERLVEGIRK